ncbi:HNH endonuclease [Arthrobacter sp. MYb227]|nr:HNH endonuclease [Arthrobacter sp. MYb227]
MSSTAEIHQVHRLDPETASTLDELAANPQLVADATIPPERMCSGMSPHRSLESWMLAHLHISSAEAKRRLTGAHLLIAPIPNSDEPTPTPIFPILAQAAADGSADVGSLAQLAGRMQSMQPRIENRPDAQAVNTAIEEAVVHETRTAQPRHGHKALNDWGNFLAEHGSPMTDEEIRARRGWFFRGFRNGSDEYLLRCDPADSESLISFAQQWANPKNQIRPPGTVSTSGPRRAPSTQPDTQPGTPPGTSPEQPPLFATPGASAEPSMPDEPDKSAESDEQDESLVSEETTSCDSLTRDGVLSPQPTPGTPIPAWAVAEGTDPSQLPVSEWPIDTSTINTDSPSKTTSSTTQELWDLLESRTSPQLLLDGIIAAINAAMNGTGFVGAGGQRFKIGILIGYRSLLGLCDEAGITSTGRPISAATVRRLACNGDLLPAVLGSEGEILDLGREVRSFTNAQRKALAIRDRGCVYPGCSRPAATTEAHHVNPWSEGGQTNVGNGACLCLHHHLMLHAGLFTLEMINGIPYVTERAGQPRGDPERNLYWHPELRTRGFSVPLFDA